MTAQRNPRRNDATARRRNGVAPAHRGRAEAEPALWRSLARLGARVPRAEWEKLPRDLSKHVDHYLYGGPKRP